MSNLISLKEFIHNTKKDFPYPIDDLVSILTHIEQAAKSISNDIRNAGLAEHVLGTKGSQNIQGEEQQKLDVIADIQFIKAFENSGLICGFASEENDDFIAFKSNKGKNAPYIALFDPLDGSSNIDVNVSIGTIFSVYKRISPLGSEAIIDDMLQEGSKQILAGYILYGSSTMLVFTAGNGVNGFTLDTNKGNFYLSHPNMLMPENGRLYAMNEGNVNECEIGLRDYITYCQSRENQTGMPYSGRYVGSLVADFHRNLIKGGIYIYPDVLSAPNGKLRLLYECNPLAFIAEQAGGLASTGRKRILEINPEELHQRVPYYVGSKLMVEKAISFIKNS